MLERALVRTLKDVESRTAASTDLTDQVTRGLRSRRRRSALALGALAVVAVAGGSTTTWLLADDSSTSPSAAGSGARTDCSSVQARGSGVSSYRTANGGRELTLLFSGRPGTRDYTCPIDDRLDITLTTPRGAQLSSIYATTDTELIRPGTSIAVDLSWTNWCHSGPITATATFPDGISASFSLGKNSAKPRCTRPEQPASLEVSRVQLTSVATPE